MLFLIFCIKTYNLFFSGCNSKTVLCVQKTWQKTLYQGSYQLYLHDVLFLIIPGLFEPPVRTLRFFRNYPLLLLYPMYLNFASSNCLPHLPYIVRFIIFNRILPFTIIISTHEENFYEIMKVKLSSEYYNSKFFVFESEGRII